MIKGTVEAVSTKFNKFSVMVNDTWYSTKEEWAPSPRPEKGDLIEFDNKGAKFLNRCKILGKSGGGSPAPSGGGSKSGGYSSIGVELGHAANLAQRVVEVMYCEDQLDAKDVEVGSAKYWATFADQTLKAYKVMKSLRARVEAGSEDAPTKEEPAAPPPAPEPEEEDKSGDSDFEDLF